MKKKLLAESFEITKVIRPQLQESEGSDEKKWVAPVWNLDVQNLNGRIYPTALAKRVVEEGKKTLAYDGHDAAFSTGAEYSIAKAVCSNPRIEDGYLWVDIDFVDHAYRKLLEDILSKGIAIGVSSCGYGDVDDDGVVNPETYEVVRFLDFVTSPAGEVYAKMKEEKAEEPKNPSESMDEERAKAMAESRRKVAKGFLDILL